MITKLLIFVLTFFLAILNITISLIPLDLLLVPLALVFPELADQLGTGAVIVVMFFITSYILLYLILDWVFSLTVRTYTKHAVPIAKAGGVVGYRDIEASFNWLVKRYALKGVSLYIDGDAKTVNAYAISGMRKKAVIITMGLINKMHKHADNPALALEGIRGILGHELSHVANNDSLPAVLTFANESAIAIIDKIMYIIFKGLSLIFHIIPIIGGTLSWFFMSIYNLLHFVLMSVYRYLFMPLYQFLQKALSRSVEFRCDRQAAYAFGGQRVATGLSVLGPGAYFSVFSTHPRTKTRIRKVQDIKVKEGTVRPSIFSQLTNIASVLVIAYFWYMLLLLASHEYFPSLYLELRHLHLMG